MANRKALVLNAGRPQQIQSGDVLDNGLYNFLASGGVANAATCPIDLTLYYNLHTKIRIEFYGGKVFTNTANLLMRVSTDAVTYDAAAASYQGTLGYSNTGAGGIGSASATSMQISSSSGTTANYTINGHVDLWNMGSATNYFAMSGHLIGVDSTGLLADITFGGFRIAQQVTKAIQFLFSAGNITLNWKAYGLI